MHPHFVIPPQFASEVAALPDRRLGEDYPYWLGGRFNWVAQSWLVLRQFREGLTLGTAPAPGRVNFGHVMFWREHRARVGEFRVSVRADYHRMFDVDFEILQNPVAPLGPNQAYLPYWPVPGVKPRDPARRGLRSVAYAGRIGPLNLAGDLAKGSGLLPDGIEMRIIPPDQWHDLSQVDALLAIRTFDKRPHLMKPPSKLFSAWRANIPMIGGYDSAFSAVGSPGHDYIRVASAKDLTSALQRLRDDPLFYDSIVKKGSERLSSITHEVIAKHWFQTFDTKISESYERWRARRMKGLRAAAARGADSTHMVASRLKRFMSAADRE